MTKRRYEVEVSGTVTVVIDDEAVSDWDGKTILTMHENRERWSRDGVTKDDAIGNIAIQNGLYNSRDGLADFPDSAYSTYSQHFEVESVVEI